jgi:hypothetical protein
VGLRRIDADTIVEIVQFNSAHSSATQAWPLSDNRPGRRWPNENRAHEAQSSTPSAPNHDATRSFDLNSEALPAAFDLNNAGFTRTGHDAPPAGRSPKISGC